MKRPVKPVAIQDVRVLNLLIHLAFKNKTTIRNTKLEISTLRENPLKLTKIGFRAFINIFFLQSTFRDFKLSKVGILKKIIPKLKPTPRVTLVQNTKKIRNFHYRTWMNFLYNLSNFVIRSFRRHSE